MLVTGAAGFVGRHVCGLLADSGYRVRASVREFGAGSANLAARVEPCVTGELGPHTDWSVALRGVQSVVHLAARVHVTSDRSTDPRAEYAKTNFQATATLARAAADAGVRRLVFLSSARVNGPSSGDKPFTERDVPAPAEPYDESKLQAERVLGEAAARSGLQIVILRSPLVYGPGVKANFLSLMRAVDRRLPLPLGAIRNRRSLIYAGNLAHAIRSAIEHRDAAARLFMLADGEDVSTPALIEMLARALGRPALLVPVPVALLRLAGRLTGRQAAIERLCASLQVDASAIRQVLGWRPPFSLEQGIAATARWFRAEACARATSRSGLLRLLHLRSR